MLEMAVDDMPVWMYLGEVEMQQSLLGAGRRTFLFTHFSFSIGYNDDRVRCRALPGAFRSRGDCRLWN